MAKSKILIVDDDPQLRQALRLALKSEGFRCDEAENGRRALEKLCEATVRQEPYDLVLLDIMMPEVNGWQFLQAVKSNPLWSQTKIVIVTGRSLSPQEIAQATALDCLHVEKRGGFLESLTQMLTRMATV